jgi:uncharacterized membrane protein YhhN
MAFVLFTFIKPYPFSWLMKVMPIIILLHFSWQNHTDSKSTRHMLFIAGLAFSACGDFFLDYDRVNWFVFGLGSFLIAHLFYIFSLKPLRNVNIIKNLLPIVAVYCLYGISMFSLIFSGLGELFIPVLIYMTVLLVMGIFTLLSTKSNAWLVVGGISFIASDSLLGINKFYQPIPYASVWIMISYYFAQFSLVKGMFEQK